MGSRSKSHDDEAERYLVLWWMSQKPCAALFSNHVSAQAAASVRNGVVVAFSGRETRVLDIEDWYRRDEDGRPMLAEMRDLGSQERMPWMASHKAAPEEAAAEA